MGYIHSVQIDNTPHLIEPSLYATAGGTSSALTAGISNFGLFPGAYINVKVNEVAANATLNVSNTGAYDIYYNGAQINANTLTADNIYTFIYDGQHWVIVGDITGKNIMIGTNAEWAAHNTYRAPKGTICIYTDYQTYTDSNENTIIIPGIKVSDGLAYIADQPFIDYDIRTILNDHINDNVKHVTAEEREFWNHKLNCNIVGEELQLNRS